MLVKFLKAMKASPDGVFTHSYVVGQEAELPESLAIVFIKRGVCSDPTIKPKKVTKKKSLNPVEENK